MAHWCLQGVDYQQIDFNPRRLQLNTSKAKCQSDDCDSGIESVSSYASSVSGHAQTLARVDPDELSSPRSDMSSVSTGTAWVIDNLRDVIQDGERHREIPNIIGNWPAATFCLAEIMAASEMERYFTSLDKMWTHLFHGLLLTTSYSKLSCIDLTGFVPTKGLLYTMLQLVPLLSLPPATLDKKCIFDLIVSNLGLSDAEMLQNLDQYLHISLDHRVYKRGRKLKFYAGKMDIILDYLPLSADKLDHLCFATAVGIQDMTKVTIHPKSIVFTYAEPGPEFTSMDPLLPLLVTKQCSLTKSFSGLGVVGVPQDRIEYLLAQLDEEHRSPFKGIKQLAISDCGLYLGDAFSHRVHLTSLLSGFTNLKRLDLRFINTAGYFGQLLKEIPCPLEYINLSHAEMELDDIYSLCISKHAASLVDLNLGYVHPTPCEACRRPDGSIGSDSKVGLFAETQSDQYDSSGDITPPVVQGYSSDETTESSNCSSHWHHRQWEDDISGRATPCEHETFEAQFYQKLVKTLKNFPKLVLLDISSKLSHFRLDQETLLILLENVTRMKSLKQLCLEEVPLWNDEIFDIVGVAANHQSLHSLILSRSVDAPSLQMTDKFDFWKKMHNAKKGKFIKTAIANFVDEYMFGLPDSDDDNSVFESISSFEM